MDTINFASDPNFLCLAFGLGVILVISLVMYIIKQTGPSVEIVRINVFV